MKALVFDAGPIISFTTNGLLWLLEPLKKRFSGKFLLVKSVKGEIVDHPLRTKKFKFEALQVQGLIDNGVFEVVDSPAIRQKTKILLDSANSIFSAHRQPISIVQLGEMESIAAVNVLDISHIAIDERITRSLLENPQDLRRLMERRLHTKVYMDKQRLRKFQSMTRHIKLIRSAELVTIGYELGLLDKYIVKVKQPRKELLDSILWGMKLNGCAITDKEIKEIVQLELKR